VHTYASDDPCEIRRIGIILIPKLCTSATTTMIGGSWTTTLPNQTSPKPRHPVTVACHQTSRLPQHPTHASSTHLLAWTNNPDGTYTENLALALSLCPKNKHRGHPHCKYNHIRPFDFEVGVFPAIGCYHSLAQHRGLAAPSDQNQITQKEKRATRTRTRNGPLHKANGTLQGRRTYYLTCRNISHNPEFPVVPSLHIGRYDISANHPRHRHRRFGE
jgi:hypothetical protein